MSDARGDCLYLAKITVTTRKSILDPQGKAVHHALASLSQEHFVLIRRDRDAAHFSADHSEDVGSQVRVALYYLGAAAKHQTFELVGRQSFRLDRRARLRRVVPGRFRGLAVRAGLDHA